MKRPELNDSLPPTEFRAWCWLKAELVEFCQRAKLSTAGSKIEIADRIEVFLSTGEKPAASKTRAARGQMPRVFTRETLIGTGWRCTPELRTFFEAELGRGFRFNGVVRDFIHNRGGATLGEAIAAYQAGKGAKSAIALQFEYNRFSRAYFAANPKATKAEAVAAWMEKRNSRKS